MGLLCTRDVHVVMKVTLNGFWWIVCACGSLQACVLKCPWVFLPRAHAEFGMCSSLPMHMMMMMGEGLVQAAFLEMSPALIPRVTSEANDSLPPVRRDGGTGAHECSC